MTFYPKLLAATASGRDYLLASELIHQAMAGTMDAASYAAYLTQAFHHV
ncbi:biliverdin-producing heme oxygenase, partial [Aquitalea sp. S1-19]|nr:biliverdin-producing heme oxygenase [Aquitalea sp. S1-19]